MDGCRCARAGRWPRRRRVVQPLRRPFRSFFTVLAAGILIVPVAFAQQPGIRRLIVPETKRSAPADPGTAGFRPVPIVLIVFDELPLVSLLDERRNIDPNLYPNMSALAHDGVWFRNATTVSAYTRWALPAIVTGLRPKRDAVPTSGNYPDTLFSFLGRTHRFEVIESLSAMCPRSLCVDPTDTVRTAPLRHRRGPLDHRRVCVSHARSAQAPATTRPDEQWAGFKRGADAGMDVSPRRVAKKPRQALHGGSAATRRVLHRGYQRVRSAAHAVLPSYPAATSALGAPAERPAQLVAGAAAGCPPGGSTDRRVGARAEPAASPAAGGVHRSAGGPGGCPAEGDRSVRARAGGDHLGSRSRLHGGRAEPDPLARERGRDHARAAVHQVPGRCPDLRRCFHRSTSTASASAIATSRASTSRQRPPTCSACGSPGPPMAHRCSRSRLRPARRSGLPLPARGPVQRYGAEGPPIDEALRPPSRNVRPARTCTASPGRHVSASSSDIPSPIIGSPPVLEITDVRHVSKYAQFDPGR